MNLKINLPAIQTSVYKDNPGVYAIETIRFLSAGQEAYHVDVKQYLRDYLESLNDEHYAPFTETYLGNTGGAASGAARVLLIPILLPNSAYMQRHGHNTRGSGIWPCFTAQNRLEIQITLNESTFVSVGSNFPATIAGKCSIMMHQVDINRIP